MSSVMLRSFGFKIGHAKQILESSSRINIFLRSKNQDDSSGLLVSFLPTQENGEEAYLSSKVKLASQS